MFLGTKDSELYKLSKMPKDDFVAFCYQRLLARNGDSNDKNRASKILTSGQGRFSFIKDLVSSDEFYERLSLQRLGLARDIDSELTEEEVYGCYRLLLDRMPKPEELKLALQEFVNIKHLRNFLLLSEEFQTGNETLRHIHQSAIVIKDLSASLRIYLDLADRFVCNKILYGSYKLNERNFVRSILKPGDLAIDIGACVGFFSMHMAEVVGPSGLVYSFEPIWEHLNLLRASLGENRMEDRVRALPVAIGYKPMQTFMACPGKAESNPMGCAYLSYDEREKFGQHLRPIQVESLDTMAFEKRVSFIKISAEGAEPFVFRGGRELILKDKPIMLVDLNREKLARVADCTPEVLLLELKKIGYTCYELDEFGIKSELDRAPDIFSAVLIAE